MHIYTLELAHGKYYVGKTSNPDKRLLQHVTGSGAEWTRLHKPVKLIKLVESTSRFDEDNTTLELMFEKGIESVRGGRYVNPLLSKWEVKNIVRSLDSAYDRCFFCHESHPINQPCSSNVKKCCQCFLEYKGQEHTCSDTFKCNKCELTFDAKTIFEHSKSCVATRYHCIKCSSTVIIREDGEGYITKKCPKCLDIYEMKHHQPHDLHVCEVIKCGHCKESFVGLHICKPQPKLISCKKCLSKHPKDSCMYYLLDKRVKLEEEDRFEYIGKALGLGKPFNYKGSPKELAYIKEMQALPPTTRVKLCSC